MISKLCFPRESFFLPSGELYHRPSLTPPSLILSFTHYLAFPGLEGFPCLAWKVFLACLVGEGKIKGCVVPYSLLKTAASNPIHSYKLHAPHKVGFVDTGIYVGTTNMFASPELHPLSYLIFVLFVTLTHFKA